jgi:hypothetical protein
MNQEQLERYLGEEQTADLDPVSGELAVVGRLINERMPEADFEALRRAGKTHYVHGQWFLVTKRLTVTELILRHGPPIRVGLGPSGGFKWIQFQDQSIHGHPQLASDAKSIASQDSVQTVRCDREGTEIPRIPRVCSGKAYPISRSHAFHQRFKSR